MKWSNVQCTYTYTWIKKLWIERRHLLKSDIENPLQGFLMFICTHQNPYKLHVVNGLYEKEEILAQKLQSSDWWYCTAESHSTQTTLEIHCSHLLTFIHLTMANNVGSVMDHTVVYHAGGYTLHSNHWVPMKPWLLNGLFSENRFCKQLKAYFKECIPWQLVIIRSDIPPLFSRKGSSCYVLRNWSQRRWQGSTEGKHTASTTPFLSSLASPLSPCLQRKVQRVPCVWAQRSKWYSLMWWYSPIVTPQHTNTRCCPAGAAHSAHWPSASPSILGMTHKPHTVQTHKIQIYGYNPGDRSDQSDLSSPVHTLLPHYKDQVNVSEQVFYHKCD